MKLFGGFNFEKNNKIESSFEDFVKKENGILNKANGFLMELAPEKFKKPAAAMLTAFALFAEASSVYAEGGIKEQETRAEEIKKSDSIFDWKKIAERLEISASGKVENIEKSRQDVVVAEDLYLENADKMAATEFYKDFNPSERQEAISVFSEFYTFDNSQEFFNYLQENKDNLNDRQKAYLLQMLGSLLDATYNYDMLEEERIVMSDDFIYGILRDYYNGDKSLKTGLCGNVHNFLSKAAKNFGIESWLQSGKMDNENHVWSGMALESNGKKQIVFLNYGDLIATGTLSYKDALGVAERYMKRIGIFNSFVSADGKILKVESRAQEEIEKSADIDDADVRLEKRLADGEIKRENVLEINLNPEVKKVKLTKNHLILSFYNYEDVYNNPFQSLDSMNAARGGVRFGGQKLGLEANATVLNMNIKDLEGGAVERNEFIGSLMVDYVDGHKFSKKEYGQFEARWGATLNTAISMFNSDSYSSMTEGSVGGRLIYVNPGETGKFYIGAAGDFRMQANDMEDQEQVIKNSGINLTVGSSIKVQEVKILNLEAAVKNADWGNVYKAKGGLAGEKLAGEIEYEKDDSKFERFIPSGEKISASIGYKASPKYSISISGFKSAEKYKDADKIEAYGGEVKFIINMF